MIRVIVWRHLHQLLLLLSALKFVWGFFDVYNLMLLILKRHICHTVSHKCKRSGPIQVIGPKSAFPNTNIVTVIYLLNDWYFARAAI
jgi:hypothetical protein